ncbi:hypothetical protein [Streptomyces endophytica]|uniref:Uncharacterized protein n=1 Tax=Streptomyces endophytica TaxID=2991496 RepID=A0ABY6PH03_9ACTN|nr:hypothetical protein [Streptomyces endophytica]UZJ33159.1 hypothetical protein OJ254_26340 [Streptomyces endophytica]
MRKPKPLVPDPVLVPDRDFDPAADPVSIARSREYVELAEPVTRATRGVRLRQWVRRHRRDAAAHLLRGTCYGLGTGAVGLAFWWIQQQL